jgi:hypothetical protein
MSGGCPAESVEDVEVHSGEVVGEPVLPTVAGLGLESVDEIDHVVKSAAGAGADAASGDGDSHMGLAGTGSANRHGITLLGDKVRAGIRFRMPLDSSSARRSIGRKNMLQTKIRAIPITIEHMRASSVPTMPFNSRKKAATGPNKIGQ